MVLDRDGIERKDFTIRRRGDERLTEDNISAGITDKDNVWAVNTEQEYHEEKNDS